MLALRRTAVALLVSSLSALPLLTTLALVCSTRDARANGRFPQAQAFETVPGGDGSSIFLRTTFGILVSRDAGTTWQWICERALGYDGSWDPPIAVTHDGRLWVGLERGLVSTLDGCTVDTATELNGEQVKDLTVDPKGETLWALTGAPEKAGAIWRRSPSDSDGGAARWQRMGTMPENINPMTIEVAPSKPSRIYVSGQPYGTVRGWLWRSDDGGKTINGAANALEHSGPFFIAAVDPKDANRVLLRHLHTTGSTVLITADSGKTFKEVLSMDSAMFGFAKSSDGLTYFAGSGLPQDGIFRSTDRGEHFDRVTNHGVLCLHDAPGGRLFVCENPATLGGPAIGLSRDRGATVSTIATFGDVRGPVACGADAAANGGADADAGGGLCAAAWPETRIAVLPRLPRATASIDAGGEPDAGARRGPDEVPARRSTCGCELVGSSEKALDHAWLTTGLLPLVVWARARSRRGSRRDQRCPSAGS